MVKKTFLFVVIGIILAEAIFYFANSGKNTVQNQVEENQGGLLNQDHPLSIRTLKNGKYPGSDIIIEQTLSPAANYQQYIASYKSEGLKIYALLTIPTGEKPDSGWPAIVFNHGYIPPYEYRTTERYVAYVEGFAGNGYIVFKPDYRGHGNSEGTPTGTYGSNNYTIDVLNAVASIKKYKDADPKKIGMWGHSMGGYITLRNMVARNDIKAGVIWAGVVASYPDLLSRWRRRPTPIPGTNINRPGSWRQLLTEQYGRPEQNPQFWNSISANSYLSDISGPLQLHHGTADESVPLEFSEKLAEQMKAAGKEVELYTYEGNDHNISASFNLAMQRSVEFFDKYLKKEN